MVGEVDPDIITLTDFILKSRKLDECQVRSTRKVDSQCTSRR